MAQANPMDNAWIGPEEGEMLLDFEVVMMLHEGSNYPGINPFRDPTLTPEKKQQTAALLQPLLVRIKQNLLQQGKVKNWGKQDWDKMRRYKAGERAWIKFVKIFGGIHNMPKEEDLGTFSGDIDMITPHSYRKVTYNWKTSLCFFLLIGSAMLAYSLIFTIIIKQALAQAVTLALDPPWVIPLKYREDINFQCIGNHPECNLPKEVGDWKQNFTWVYQTPINETIGLEIYAQEIAAKLWQQVFLQCKKGPRDLDTAIKYWICFYDTAIKYLLGYEHIQLCPLGGYLVYDNTTKEISMCTPPLSLRLLNFTLSQEKWEQEPFTDIVWFGNKALNTTVNNITQVQINVTMVCNVIVPEQVGKKKGRFQFYNEFLGPWGGGRFQEIIVRYQDWVNISDPILDLNCSGIPGVDFNHTEGNYTCIHNKTYQEGDICTQPEFIAPCYNSNYSIPLVVHCKLHNENITGTVLQVMRCRGMKDLDLRIAGEFVTLNLTLVKDPFLDYLRNQVNYTCTLNGTFWVYKSNKPKWDTNETIYAPVSNFTDDRVVWGAYNSILYQFYALQKFKLLKKPVATIMPPVREPHRRQTRELRQKRGLGLTIAIVGAVTAGMIGTTTGTAALAVSVRLKEVMLQQAHINEQVLGALRIVQRRLQDAERFILSLHQRVTKIERFLEIQYQLQGMCPFKDICQLDMNFNFTDYNDSWPMGRWAEQAEKDWREFQSLIDNATRSNENLKTDLTKLEVLDWFSWFPINSVFSTIFSLIIIIIVVVLARPCLENCIKGFFSMLKGYRPIKLQMVEIPLEGTTQEEEGEEEDNEDGGESCQTWRSDLNNCLGKKKSLKGLNMHH
ncbi:envelope precursor [Puma lentivirus 14]|uniref:Envelope glycoprotein gp150 n=1 Tax=Puma lentivirus 14 TaxID=32615 RepID=Q84811_9RETR|nr:envelope precursor [Puma lentivirus 14]AAA67170.1 envelope precursor [Puma lentivirus 14]